MFGRDKQQSAAQGWMSPAMPPYAGAASPTYAAPGDTLDAAVQAMNEAQATMAAVAAFEQRRLAAMPQQARVGMGMKPGAEIQNNVAVAVGVRITEIVPGGPGAAAGVQPGDLMTTLNGTPVSLPSEVRYLLRAEMVGRPVPITVRRSGVDGQLTLVPAPPE
jgi:S1-C subfamily serine protease